MRHAVGTELNEREFVCQHVNLDAWTKRVHYTDDAQKSGERIGQGLPLARSDRFSIV